MPNTKRCPRGTRKNKNGDCVKKEVVNTATRIRKRCPRGTRKNKSGDCIEYSASPITPRTSYAKQYFNKEDIYLANKNFRPEKENPLLLQLSFHDVNQFKNYVNLSSNPYLDCVYQSLFSLGLRQVKQAKKEAAYVNLFGKIGVLLSELKKYISATFEVDATKIGSKVFQDSPEENVSSFLNETLNDNYATILFVNYQDYRGIKYTHCIIAYRYKYDIVYFNPQGRGIDKEHKVLSMNLLYLVPETLMIQSAFIFTIDGLDSPKKALNIECPIGING